MNRTQIDYMCSAAAGILCIILVVILCLKGMHFILTHVLGLGG